MTDFGLAKLGLKLDDTMKTYCGTPEYLAPVIIEGKKYTKSVDWWALGCIFYEMLTGKHPFRRKRRDDMFESITKVRPFSSNTSRNL